MVFGGSGPSEPRTEYSCLTTRTPIAATVAAMVDEPAFVPRLRLVAPLIHALRPNHRFRLTALEVWDNHIRLHFAQLNGTEAQEDQWDHRLGCTITDDLGTRYHLARESLASCSSHGLLGHGSVEFAPGPPAEASALRVQGAQERELVAVSLA
jgi:hypothetical protein